MKILAVDDDAFALSLVEAALAEHGFNDVVTATSGEDAINLIEKSRTTFDCFLLDLRMPEMDGVELCTHIRTFEEYKNSPVIFVTAVSDRACINSAYAAGAVDYISKPIDPIEIGIRVSVAEKLVMEEREKKKTKLQASAMQEQLDSILKFSVEDPVPISDVPRVISKLALENYLLGLGRAKMFNSSVTAFAINEIEAIFRKASPTEMYFFLTDIADAISISLKHTDSLICYNGYGEFICVTKRADSALNEELEFAINSKVSSFELAYDDGTPCEVSISMGEPAQATIWSTGNPLMLIQSALKSVGESQKSFRVVPTAGNTSSSFRSPILNL